MEEIFFAWCQEKNKQIGSETSNENQAWGIAKMHYDTTKHLTTVMSIVRRSSSAVDARRRVTNQTTYRSNWVTDKKTLVKRLTNRKKKDGLPLLIEEQITNYYEITELKSRKNES